MTHLFSQQVFFCLMQLLFQKWCQEIITGTNAADQWKGPFLVRDSPLLLLLSQHKIRARWLPFPIPFTGIIISSFISSPSQHLFLNDEPLCGRRHFYYKSPNILHIFSSQKNKSPQVFPSFFFRKRHIRFFFSFLLPPSASCLSVWLVSPSLSQWLFGTNSSSSSSSSSCLSWGNEGEWETTTTNQIVSSWSLDPLFSYVPYFCSS